ncbi:MBL fold metallo-hydrolase [Ahniella affigens]|nr:MBL fold metallo-hydrolase [Ahniella affigens]
MNCAQTTIPGAPDQQLFLRGDVKAEPLINRWYAWSYMISPVSYALISRNLHMRVLESYLKSPKLHAQASRNQDLKGGLFVDYDGDLATMRQFVDQSRGALQSLTQLGSDIVEFDSLLQTEATGDAMASLYARLPESLRGRVELTYDLYNHPRMRFIEALFYDSPLYRQDLQCMSLSLMTGDERPFVLSSPRLPDEKSLTVSWPFADPRWDQLFAMRQNAKSVSEFCALVGWEQLSLDERAHWSRFVTTTPPPVRSTSLPDGEVRIRYFGHATVLMYSNEVSVLTDPIVAYPMDGAVPRYSFHDLPDRIDYVVLTHNHQDHVMFETLLQLRHRIGTIVVPKSGPGTLPDLSLKLMLQATGFAHVVELGELETLPIANGQILGVPFLGEHGDLELQTKLAFRVQIRQTSALFAADSDNLDPELYRRAAAKIAPLNHLFIGMECVGAPMSWVYGPLFTRPPDRRCDQARRLNGSDAERAWHMVDTLQPDAVHIYAMGSEPWLTFISSIEYHTDSPAIVESDRLIARCNEAGIPASRLYGRHEIPCQRIPVSAAPTADMSRPALDALAVA